MSKNEVSFFPSGILVLDEEDDFVVVCETVFGVLASPAAALPLLMNRVL